VKKLMQRLLTSDKRVANISSISHLLSNDKRDTNIIVDF